MKGIVEAEFLVYRTILKIYCRSYFEYLVIENVVRSAAKSMRLGIEPREESPSSLSVLLFIEEKLRDIRAIESAIKDVTKARFL